VLWVAVVFALGSALAAALSTATQHHVAGSAPPSGSVRGLLAFLVRRPLWVAALLLGPLGFACHVVALHHGPLALVQPLAISGIVLAVPMRAAWSQSRPCRREIRAVAVTAAAIAGLLLVSDPRAGGAPVDTATMRAAVLVTAAGAGAALVASGRVARPVPRAHLLGAAAGLLFGLMAVLMKVCSGIVSAAGVTGLPGSWAPYALVAAGLGGVVVNQLAYRTARLSASMPVLNVVNCLLALGFGYVVLGDSPRDPLLAVVAGVPCLVAMGWGLRELARESDAARGEASARAPVS
jgi:hypothetical protein